ncbi:hypothetical protein D9757_003512 [Collybiopsis confluens]|uniref:PIK-related kinase FAT domain-containing protein n=1 Tax=Collybiopsis confluens TaxID=2823264 RepID=A0A8H5HTI0_9AGAR|nr:hypothetical protein D9757_003512 [Collybiopsis confluens]
MHLHKFLEDGPDDILTSDNDEGEIQNIKSKVRPVRARMHESERFEARTVLKTFRNATDLIPHQESGQYYLGQFQDECYNDLPHRERLSRGLKMNLSIIKAYAEAINLGTKYIYQTVPRLLTLWLDLGEEKRIPDGIATFQQINLALEEGENFLVFGENGDTEIVSTISKEAVVVHDEKDDSELKRWVAYPPVQFSSSLLPVYDGYTLPPMDEESMDIQPTEPPPPLPPPNLPSGPETAPPPLPPPAVPTVHTATQDDSDMEMSDQD